jgi:hypothetical protein
MGLLDDAIREHLDLKRRRGADPTEIERAEREALGPVRRGPEQLESDDLAAEDAAALPHDPDAPGEPLWDGGYAGDSDPFPARLPDTAHHGEDAPAYDELTADHELDPFDAPLPRDEPDAYKHPLPPEEEAPPRPRFSQTALPDDDREDDRPPAPHPAAGSTRPRGDETIEYSVADAISGEEDVLEETPEFLQDAPEHDRLWFEQRPPRDFDFNE